MGQTGNSLVIVFSIVLLLSLVVLSFETADAQKDPDKGKKKYPYTESVWECENGKWAIVIYEYTSPNKKRWLMKLISLTDDCNPGDEPPKRGGIILLVQDNTPLMDATYTPPALDAEHSQLLKHNDFNVTALPEVVAQEGQHFRINTLVSNKLTEGLVVQLTPIMPDEVPLRFHTGYPLFIPEGGSVMIYHQWECLDEVVRADYGFTFIGYPNSKSRVDVIPLKVTNKVTCLESVTEATGTIQFGTEEDPISMVFPEPSGKKQEKEPKDKKSRGGAEPQAFTTPSGNYLPPVKQMKMGITAEEVTCNEGKELIFKSANGSPKCVSMVAAEKLVARGWATR